MPHPFDEIAIQAATDALDCYVMDLDPHEVERALTAAWSSLVERKMVVAQTEWWDDKTGTNGLAAIVRLPTQKDE